MSNGENEKFEVAIHDRVIKKLRKIPSNFQSRIVQAISDLENEPTPHNSIKLKGSDPGYRIRIGDYRIIYDIDYEAWIIQVRVLMSRGEGYNRHLHK